MRTALVCVVGLLLGASSFSGTAQTGRWGLFRSETGFSVSYPESWVRKGISKDRLTILSSTGGADAVVIKDGQAEISVAEAEIFEKLTLAALIDHYTTGAEVLSRLMVENKRSANGGCKTFEKVVSKESLVPHEDGARPVPYIVNTDLFCEINHDKFVVALRNFEGDKGQELYQRIAFKMAETLRARQ
jgi:hypothetical protein